jgi:hypothetical protein
MKLNPKIAISETGFIFDPTTGDSFTTNSTGKEILSHLSKGANHDEIKYHIMKQYEVTSAEFENAFQDFIVTLKQFQLLEDDE